MLDNSNVAPGKNKTLRCAIYTRKSHEEGLEQEFNSLDAQRESAEHYIEAQRMRGWTALPDRYDDGGFSGGNMERPGLRRLLADIDAGKIDVIVVYKVDRLSRSLLDFMKMIDLFNEKGVSFRLGYPALQHHRPNRPDVSRHPDYLRPVRAGGHRRAHPGQGGGRQAPGEILRRRTHSRIRRRPG